jgi:peptide chain release factor
MTEVVLHLSAGQGPEECRWVVAQLATAFRREAAAFGLECEALEPVSGPAPSLLLAIRGPTSESFAEA